MIKVSVIMPVYNAEKYLEETLECLVHQTLQEIEIICIDDGSTDRSGRILEKYRRLDQRIFVLSQKNAGAGAARNRGLMYASGRYLSILDADDVFEPDMLEASYWKAEKDQADICVFKMDQFMEDTKRSRPCHWSLAKDQLPDFEPFAHRDLSGNIFKVFVGWTWDKLFRREFVLAEGLRFQPIRTSNDLFFTFTALVKAERISVLSRTLVHQRTGQKDSLSVTREKSWDCFYQALLALRQELMRMGIYEEVERSYVNYALHFSLWNLNSLGMPAFEKLYEKLAGEYSAELGIQEKGREYFWNQEEYRQYEHIQKMTPEEYLSAFHLTETDRRQKHCSASEVWEECGRLCTGIRKSLESGGPLDAAYQVHRYRVYRDAFSKVTEDEKWAFVRRMREAFQEAEERRELAEEVFEDLEWDELQELLREPADYYAHRLAAGQAQMYEQRLAGQAQMYEQRLVQQEAAIKNSRTWKLGSMFTSIPGKMRKRKG